MSVKQMKSLGALQTTVVAATATMLIGFAGQSRANDNTGMVTWSISGSTAMRNFTVGVPGSSTGGLTLPEPGAPVLSLSNGTYSGGNTGLQLAPSTFTGNALGANMGSGVRVEWHEAGSVEG